MDFGFMGGSMGSVVGEKFVRACEAAAERRVPYGGETSEPDRYPPAAGDIDPYPPEPGDIDSLPTW